MGSRARGVLWIMFRCQGTCHEGLDDEVAGIVGITEYIAFGLA